jgi:tetratricopeptide (TPR) repeat protein
MRTLLRRTLTTLILWSTRNAIRVAQCAKERCRRIITYLCGLVGDNRARAAIVRWVLKGGLFVIIAIAILGDAYEPRIEIDPVRILSEQGKVESQSEVIARHIEDQIQTIYSRNDWIATRQPLTGPVATPKITLPGTGFQFEDVRRWIQRLLGIEWPRVNVDVEFTEEGNERGATLTLRLFRGPKAILRERRHTHSRNIDVMARAITDRVLRVVSPYVLASDLHFTRGRTKEALSLVEETWHSPEHNFEGLRQGTLLILSLKNDKMLALEMAEEAVRRNGNDPKNLDLMAYVLAASGRPEAAAASAKRSIDRFPFQSTAYATLARMLTFQRRLPEARKVLAQALDRQPRSIWAYNTFWESLGGASEGEIEAFSRRVDRLIRLEPDLQDGYLLKARLYHHFNKDNDALEMLRRAIRVEPFREEAYDKLSEWLYVPGRDGKIVPIFLEEITNAPGVWWSYKVLGNYYEHIGELGKAVSLLYRYVSLVPSHLDGHRFLGTILISAGRTEEGLAALERGASESLPDPGYYGEIFAAMARLHQWKEITDLDALIDQPVLVWGRNSAVETRVNVGAMAAKALREAGRLEDAIWQMFIKPWGILPKARQFGKRLRLLRGEPGL